MDWWAWVLVAWAPTGPIVGIVLGRAVHLADRRELGHGRPRGRPGATPAPRRTTEEGPGREPDHGRSAG